MRLLKPSKVNAGQPVWNRYDNVELMVSGTPHLLYIRNDRGTVAFPADIYRKFKSLEDIIVLIDPYLERMNAIA